MSDLLSKLMDLQRQFERGKLTQEQYDRARGRLLGKRSRPTGKSGPAARRSRSKSSRVGAFEVDGDPRVAGCRRIHRARHVDQQWGQALGGEVSLHLLDQGDDSEQLGAFLDEARRGLALRHSGLLPIYEVFRVQGQVGCVAGPLNGTLLSDQLPGEGRSLGDAIDLLRGVAEGLDHLHGAGLCHGHLRPEHIHVSEGGASQLIDFGLVSPGGAGFWAAPDDEPSAATDRFALGLMAYVLLTGKLPWPAAAAPEVITAAKEGGALLSLQEHLPEIPEIAGACIDGLLSASPADRPASAGALIEALVEARDDAIIEMDIDLDDEFGGISDGTDAIAIDLDGLDDDSPTDFVDRTELNKRFDEAVLIQDEGLVGERQHRLAEGEFTIGRSKTCHIRLRGDKLISRVHCKLIREGTMFTLKDNNSSNGTLVDEQLVTTRRLVGGERISVGGSIFRFVIPARATGETAVPEPVPMELELTDLFEQELTIVPDSPIAAAPTSAVEATTEPIQTVATDMLSEIPQLGVLLQDEGTSHEKRHPIAGEQLTIGRGSRCDIRLRNDKRISRQHCVVTLRGGRFFIEDCGSSNGTIVNGDLIDRRQLDGGEKIEVGESAFRFRLE